VKALLAAGHQAWLGAPGDGALEAGAREQRVPFLGGFRLGRGVARVLAFPRDARHLRKLVAENRIEAVHVHRSDDQLLARMALGRKRSVALVRTWHRDPAAVPAPLLGRLAKACDACCCVARSHAEVLKRAGAPRALYLPPAVDLERFQPRRNNQPEGTVLLGLIGRMKAKEDRGHQAFLRVLEKLDSRLPWRARLLGRGEGTAGIQRLIDAHPFKARITILDAHRDFPAQVAALDLGFVFAIGSDGTSRPAVELLACGVPLLAAELSGLCELAEDIAAARALPPLALDRWAAEAQRIIVDAQGLQAMKAAARMRAEAVHALAVRGASLAGLYAHPV